MSKISAYPPYTTPIDNDVIIIDDVTTNQTKKIKRGDFMKGAPIVDPTITGSLDGDLFSGKYSGWVQDTNTYTYAANNGNKEFVLTATSDPTTYLSPGMRFRVTRNVNAPAQCMGFVAASSQYANRLSASLSNMTFTTVFTVEAWVYLNSYNTGQQGILTRSNGSTDNTGGWDFEISNIGQVRGFYGTTSSFTDFISYQSVPLKRWTHVALAITSLTGKTANIYIDGNLVPSYSPLTSATALAQSNVNLTVGARPNIAGGTFLDGFLSEIRLWTTTRTQQQIQDNMNISLVGNESGLLFLAHGNGNFNDSTSNANNLTAQGGASSTQNLNPYNNVEYGIITKVTSTQITVFGGANYGFPNMTLNTPAYSPLSIPFGFPASRGIWQVETAFNYTETVTIPAVANWINSHMQIAVPTGAWRVHYKANMQLHSDTAGTRNGEVGLSNSTYSVLTNGIYTNSTVGHVPLQQGANDAIGDVVAGDDYIIASMATFTLAVSIRSSSGAEQFIFSYNNDNSYIIAECSYV